MAWTAALAVLVEASAYASLAFEEMRVRWSAVWLVVMAPAPYVIYSAPSGVFSAIPMLLIWAGAGAAAWWFRALPRSRWADAGFVLLMASPLVFGWFPLIYARPVPNLRLEILGQLLWIRIGVLAILQQRPERGIQFGFVPTRAEWRTGLMFGAGALAVVYPLVVLTGFARFGLAEAAWWKIAGGAVGTFAGILWVVALSEEFFFRGLLQQWFEQWWGNAAAAVTAASVLFGAVHLGFREFPNWKFAALAAVAGLFYGLAFRKGGGIRASMVAHALVVAVWRTAFR